MRRLVGRNTRSRTIVQKVELADGTTFYRCKMSTDTGDTYLSRANYHLDRWARRRFEHVVRYTTSTLECFLRGGAL